MNFSVVPLLALALCAASHVHASCDLANYPEWTQLPAEDTPKARELALAALQNYVDSLNAQMVDGTFCAMDGAVLTIYKVCSKGVVPEEYVVNYSYSVPCSVNQDEELVVLDMAGTVEGVFTDNTSIAA